MLSKTMLATIGLYSLGYAQKLTKPTLEDSLDYLKQPLMDHMPSVPSTNNVWNGWIPTDCAQMAKDASLDPNDVSTYNVTYDDCDTPWILCRHKDSPSPVGNMIDLFGRVPVHMRQWVRHMIALPDPNGGHAYNEGGNIAMFDKIENDLTVFIHETGHSLDLLGAYSEHPLSSSQYWLTQYALDSNTCDPYAQTNQVENVAQTTVVAAFNENVPGKPGGFASVEKNYMGNFHQYATLQTEADRAAPGMLLKPGGKCTHRLENSAPIKGGLPIVTAGSVVAGAACAALNNCPPSTSRIMRRADIAPMPDVSLSSGVEVIPGVDFNTKEHCKHTW